MAVTTFSCPECQAVLKTSSPVAAGKKIRCPKCDAVFALPEAGAPSAAIAAAPGRPLRRSAPVDEEDQFGEETRPRRLVRRKTPKSHAGLILGLVIGGVVVLLLTAVGVAGWVWPGFLKSYTNKGTGNEDPVAYVPGDSAFLAGLDLGAMMKLPGAQPNQLDAIKNMIGSDGFLADVKNMPDIDFKDLCDRVVFAMPMPSGPGRGMPAPMAGGMPGARPGGLPGGMPGGVPGGIPGAMPGGIPVGMAPLQNVTVILQSRVDFDQSKVRKNLKDATPMRLKGKTYFKRSRGDSQRDFLYLFMPSNRIMVFTNAPENQLEAIVRSDGTASGLPAEVVSMIRTAETGVAWLVVPFTEEARQGIEQLGAKIPPDLKMALQQAKALGAWFQMDSNQLQVTVGLACADEAGAKKAVTGSEALWKQYKFLAGTALLALGQQPALRKCADELMKNLKFTNQGALAEASTQVSMQSLQNAQQELQKNLAGGMVPGGIRPGPQPGGFPGGGRRPRGQFPPRGNPGGGRPPR